LKKAKFARGGLTSMDSSRTELVTIRDIKKPHNHDVHALHNPERFHPPGPSHPLGDGCTSPAKGQNGGRRGAAQVRQWQRPAGARGRGAELRHCARGFQHGKNMDWISRTKPSTPVLHTLR